MSAIADRYWLVRNKVADAADHVGRSPSEVTIVGVTKNVGVEEVRLAMAAGMCDFGENRVQEFVGKQALFPDARWHFVGTLQTNKVKDVVGRAHLIHSVDSLRLLETIDKKAFQAGVVQALLLQFNIAGEQTKHGFSSSQASEMLAAAAEFENVRVRGLMTMAPFGSPQEARKVFLELRNLRDSVCARTSNGVELEELSMGMTNDYCEAVEEGSTIVRIGRAIFGK